LHDSALQNICRSVVLAKLLYASSSWIGFSNATDRQKLQLNKHFSTGANDLVFLWQWNWWFCHSMFYSW